MGNIADFTLKKPKFFLLDFVIIIFLKQAVLNDYLISVIIFLRSFVDKEWRVVKV